ncbi:TetR/AcrR family transcriptional regulator [Leucobacter chromiireducens]|uniref:TetR/AcrR family transcriptional regulator n=1 Tax=Leucobacter chromiireducens TaxID=283877 RepID=UPI003F80A96D
MAEPQRESYRERTRSSARASRDARAVRTRARLIEAAEELALESPESLTAARVAARAGVSRSAFYVHFDSVTEIATTLLLDRMAYIDDGIRQDAPGAVWESVLRARVLEWIELYHAHRALFLAVRRLPGAEQVAEGGMHALASILQGLVAARPGLPDGARPEYIARWVAGAIFGVLNAWIEGEIEASAEEILEQGMALLPGWFQRDEGPGTTPSE